jgi:hypothetical protein
MRRVWVVSHHRSFGTVNPVRAVQVISLKFRPFSKPVGSAWLRWSHQMIEGRMG